MQSILKDCAVLEAKLKEFGLIGSRSPKQFLQQIYLTTNPELTLPMLMVKNEAVKDQLQAVINNAEHSEQVRDKTDAELITFTNNLKDLIEKSENYAFIDTTQGCFCREVLLAYLQHLEESYDDVLFKGDAEVFRVESVQQQYALKAKNKTIQYLGVSSKLGLFNKQNRIGSSIHAGMIAALIFY